MAMKQLRMIPKRLSTVALAAMLAVVSTHLFAQQPWASRRLAAARPDRSNVIDSRIPLGFNFPPIEGKAFRSAPVIPLHKGMAFPSRGIIGPLGLDRMLTLRQHDFRIGSQRLRMPVISLMRCSNFPNTGEFVMVIASTITFPTKLKSGAAVHGGGFLLETRREFRAGETIPAVRVIFQRKKFLFSLEQTAGPEPQPVVSAVQEGLRAADRAIALEAWQRAQQSARMGVPN
jgi:hypothetical protein